MSGILVGNKWVEITQPEDIIEEQQEPEVTVEYVKALALAVQDNYYDIGRALYILKTTNGYFAAGEKYNQPNHGGWKDFCTEQLDGVSFRTAEYWLNIYRYFSQMGVTRERLKSIGWSKAKALIDFTEISEKLEEALVVAEKHTLEDVKAYISTQHNLEGEDTRTRTVTKRFSFAFHEEAAKAVEEILAQAAEDCDGDLNSALFKIMVEWSQLSFTVRNPIESTLDVEEVTI